MKYLKGLQEQFKNKSVDKRYQALVFGRWPEQLTEVSAPLARNTLQSGERVVRVDQDGKASRTCYQVLSQFSGYTLLEARPETGRTHQIRVHCQHSGHSIVGDSKYLAGAEGLSKELLSYKNLCLHAAHIGFKNPLNGEQVQAAAPLPQHLQALLSKLEQ